MNNDHIIPIVIIVHVLIIMSLVVLSCVCYYSVLS